MNTGHNSVCDSWVKICRQEKGVADRKAPVSAPDTIAISECCMWEIIPAKQLDQGYVASGVKTDENCVVQFSIVHSALHMISGGFDHVVIGKRETVRRNEHA